MRITKIKSTLTMLEPMLGTMSGNPDVHAEYIASRVSRDRGDDQTVEEQAGREAEEVDVAKETAGALSVEDAIIKEMRLFPKDKDGLFLFDYQIRGMYKENIKNLIETREITTLSIYRTAYVVDSYVHVFPRRIRLLQPDGSPWMEAPDKLTRPLRAQTPRGERVALATSQMLPAGTIVKFETHVLNTGRGVAALKPEDIIKALEFGKYKGLSQWRGGGYGRYEHVSEVETVGEMGPEPEKKGKKLADKPE